MIEIKNIITPLEQELSKQHIAKKLGCSVDHVFSFEILKESLDARKEPIRFIYSVVAKVKNEKKFCGAADVSIYTPSQENPLVLDKPLDYRPIVVGFGPSGMFAALTLARAGCNPIILERGSSVDKRIQDVQKFWNDGTLNTESNVQFGEGGAGTFSDGKLTTRIKDPRVHVVLNALVDAGAEPKIKYQAHPHLGTDKLVDIVQNVRKTIIELGGEFHFDTRFDSFETLENEEKLLHTTNGDFKTKALFLCLGHSAKDTLMALHQQNVQIEPKSFAVGFRVEHTQDFINQSQHGKWANHHRLGAAEYRLTHTASNERGVYSFCMCPGGSVIASSSTENTIVVNGMSNSNRDDDNANSAILAQVPVSDFYHSSPLDGFNFQESIEKAAFLLGGGNYKAPVQRIEDFINNQVSTSIPTVTPSYSLGYALCNLRTLFSDEVNQALVEGLQSFDRKIKGFSIGGVITGVETRSSCPIRIPRNTSLESVSHPMVYPVGEGSGYAGGIVSSAVDGIRCAEAFIHSLNQ